MKKRIKMMFLERKKKKRFHISRESSLCSYPGAVTSGIFRFCHSPVNKGSEFLSQQIGLLMAASANPSGNNQEGSSAAAQKVSSSSAAAANGAAVNSVDNGGNSAVDNSQTISALRHNPGISVDWTHEEQSLLEDLLAKYSSFFICLCFLVLDVITVFTGTRRSLR